MSAHEPKSQSAGETPPPRVSGWLDTGSFLEGLFDNVCVIDRSWICTHANQRAIQNMGDGRNIVGRSLWAIFPELQQSKTAHALKAVMTGGTAMKAEVFHQASGEWVSANFHHVPDGLAIFSRRIASQPLRQTPPKADEPMLRTMFDRLTRGVVFHDIDGAVIDANPSAERILGISLAEMRGSGRADLGWPMVDESGLPIAKNDMPVQIALRTGETLRNIVVGFLSPDTNERRWLSVDAIPQLETGGTVPICAFTMFSDITEQKRAEEALRQSQTRLALAQRAAAVGSTVINLPGGDWEWSDQTYKMFGVTKPDFAPTLERVLSLIHAADREMFREGFEAATQGVVPYPLEFRITRPDGNERVFYHEMDLIRDRLEIPVGAIATIADITDLRAMERQKETLQRQLFHKQRLQSIGTLAGGIAHDLNNTLVPILSLSELILTKIEPSDKSRPMIELINKSGKRARDLVRQILTFSRREKPEFGIIEMAAFVRDSMRMARASVPTTIAIKTNLAEAAFVFGDESQLHQVILNLVTNAVQAIGESAGTITVELASSGGRATATKPGGSDLSVRISVSDTGCGMDEETQKRIFDPFYTTKKVGIGTGLGLSVVHSIVAAHGGRIQVSSKVGRSTRFDVFLPALNLEQARHDNESATA